MSGNAVPVVTLNDGHTLQQIACGVYRIKPGDETYNAVASALKLGYRHLDTAQLYGNEVSVGEAVRDSGIPREEIWITTKLNTFGGKYAYAATLAQIDTQLEKLKTTYSAEPELDPVDPRVASSPITL